jgi:lipoprotein-anchoring transpeptidase ErfK/SrfK
MQETPSEPGAGPLDEGADASAPSGSEGSGGSVDGDVAVPTRAPLLRLWPALAVVVVLMLGTVVFVTSRHEDVVIAAIPTTTSTTTTTAPPTTTTTTRPATTTTTFPLPVPPSSTVTATLLGSTQGYSAPNGAPTKMVTNNYYDIPTKLSVIEETPDGWLHVRTPYKPNSSTAWIKKAGVVLDSTPWAIQIDVTQRRLRLYNAGAIVLDAPVGVGTPYTPTPLGDFFVTFLQKPESAAYGPFVMITTGHSDVLQSFGGFPDGILGIHGPIGSDYAIGDTGAAISNGCIRMKVVDQVKLAQVTSGTPVHVYASPAPDPPPEPPAEPAPDPSATPGSTPTGTIPAA